jgi:phosphatidylinositol-3-phosphatase
VPTGKDDESLGGARAADCVSCDAPLSSNQRYCLECGSRRGSIPAAFAKWLSIVRPEAGSEAVSGAKESAAAGASAPEDTALAERFMPEPRSAAIATMVLLAFGVVVGAATGPLAQSAGIAPIVVEMGSSPSTASSAEPEGEASEPIAEAPVESPEATPSSVPIEPQSEGSPAALEKTKTEFPEEETLPPVQHVFMIVLGDHGYEEGFGESSQSTYLSQVLPAKGELLSNYYAVTQGALANEVALISGQGPTPATAANCPEYKDVSPGTLNAEGQAEGDGCVYPAEAKTLPGQLVEAKESWKAYVEDIGSGQAGQPAGCRRPALGGPDDAHAPRPGDAYETWRNPFVYFHSLTDSADCGERDVGLGQLEVDLKTEKQTPALSYIVPNACHDGSEVPCEAGRPAGLAGAQPFLEKVVPEIEASVAYKKSGLIAITFAQAPQNGPSPDASACCATPEYPNLPPAAAAPAGTGPVKETGGGGRVGMLLLSPFVEPGSVNETGYYNHYSMLLSIEELFGLTPIGYAANPALSAFDGTVFNLGS